MPLKIKQKKSLEALNSTLLHLGTHRKVFGKETMEIYADYVMEEMIEFVVVTCMVKYDGKSIWFRFSIWSFMDGNMMKEYFLCREVSREGRAIYDRLIRVGESFSWRK